MFDDGGITGHPDHCCATAAGLLVGQQMAIPVLAWALPAGVAEALNREFGTGFIGRPPEELDLALTVNRTRQLDPAAGCDLTARQPVQRQPRVVAAAGAAGEYGMAALPAGGVMTGRPNVASS